MEGLTPPRKIHLPIACLIVGSLTVMACVFTTSDGVDDWWDGHGPVVPHGDFPGDCALCHTSADWHSLRDDFEYDHALETGFLLEGAHAEAQCLRCHNDRGPVQYFADQGCAGCHGDVHNARLGNACLDCHQQQDWRPSGQLAEHARTRFPLFGAHAAVTCDRCHVGIASGVFDPLSTECVNCHQSDLAAATTPDHLAEGWVESCDRCHRATTWSAEGFVHDFFLLNGGHDIQCAACHANEVFQAVPALCSDCHLDLFALSPDPDHVALALPMDCERCHSSFAWAPSGFDHSWISIACADCHLDDFFAVEEPNHTLWGYSQVCDDCHTTGIWPQIIYAHPGVVDACAQCHLQDYLRTVNPSHQLWGYPQTCELCHHQFTAFPPADHTHEGVVNGCVQCHFQDYIATTDPNHIKLGLSLECEFCHIPDISWDIPTVNRPDRPSITPVVPEVRKRPPLQEKKGRRPRD